jgi:hypothetical protein
MSFLASLIGGPSKASEPAFKETKKPEKKEKTEKTSKKSFIHGINVIFKTGTYKGYHGIVSDFYPATYELTMLDSKYVEAEKYGNIKKIGEKFLSECGDSTIIKIIPRTSDTTVRIVIYRVPLSNELRLGLVLLDKQQFISEQLKKQGLSNNDINNVFQNRNNVFIVPLSLEDNSLVMNMNALNIGNATISDTLADQLNNMHISDASVAAPIQLMERFKEELGQSQTILRNIMYPERNTDINIEPVLNANIIGPMYYVNVSTQLGEFTEYNPNKIQYFIKCKRHLKFKPSMLRIDQSDKRYAYVRRGPFSNKKLKIRAYHEAHLKITLATNGRQLESHVIQKLDKSGNPILNEHGIQQYKVSPIYPSHLFYFDLHLKNGRDAQVVKILDDTIKIIEKGEESNVFIEHQITYDDVESEHPGFRIITGDESNESRQFIPYFVSESSEDTIEEVREVHDYEEDEEREVDYGEEQGEEEEGELYTESPREQQFTTSFKDSERMSSEEVVLSREQNNLKTQIERILRLLNINKNSIDIYAAVNAIQVIINKITERNNTRNIVVTSDAKYIILLVVLYYLVKNNISIPSINIIISKLYGSYFNENDIKRDELNNTIFLKTWQNELTDQELSETTNSIRTLLQSKPRTDRLKLERNLNIINIILLIADKIIQRINNTNYNISSNIKLDETLIPVHAIINKRRMEQDESEESISKKAKRESIFGKTAKSLYNY